MYLIGLNVEMKDVVARGVSKDAAMRKLREKWTAYVEGKYGNEGAMGQGGLVDLGVQPDVEDEGEELSDLEAFFAASTPDDGAKDVKLGAELHALQGQVHRFAKMFNKKDFSTSTPAAFLDGLLEKKENAQLVRYIGCLALGGEKGRAGWEELVNVPEMREAVVVGIVGRGLREHVFGELWVGGDGELRRDLVELEIGMQEEDGEFVHD